jgi:site-specific DNA-methyltransferase (adenine-specific)
VVTKIINANSFNVLDSVLADVENPVIVTDPPFNVGYHYNTYKDKKPRDEYFERLAEIGKACPCVFVHYPESIVELSMHMGKVPDRIISWVYPSNTARQHRDIAFYGVKPDFRKVRVPYRNPNDKRIKEIVKKTGGARMYDWIEINQVKNTSKEKTQHPCQMPLELMKKIVKLLPEGITVVDPFSGSGTTILACAYEGISSVGIEMDSLYASIAHERIEKELGISVVYESEGR